MTTTRPSTTDRAVLRRRAAKLRAQGLKIREVAAKLEVSYDVAYRLLSEAGAPSTRIAPEERARLQRAAVAAYTGADDQPTQTIEQIATAMSRSYGFVRTLLVEADVQLRPTGFAGRTARREPQQ